MLFNSFPFLFAFLPTAFVLHWLVERFRPSWRVGVLVLLSLVFYGYWDWRLLPLLVISIGLNWLVAELFHKSPRGALIAGAIVVNLIVLAIFKYAVFTVEALNLLPGIDLARPSIALPLGISFFTFHHIMYLTDLKAGRAPRFGFLDYAFYISFFPQVLAGPLVRWSEVMHQLGERPYLRPDAAERIGRGLMLLVIGLSKKVFVGDPLADYVNPVFAAAAAGKAITVAEAWQATLGFTFQIYFDFSGYTDMALGLALLFGIVLPQNFDTPYRATSLQDFWRRWHMTLSRFLRDYLYVAMGGNRHGLSVQLLALFATMALGGLWHGAGWTFVAWGVAHGIGLGIGVLWRRAGLPMPVLLGWALTFLFVVLTWVLFRAETFDVAVTIFKALFGFAEMGGGFKWRSIVLAAAIAMIGPTAWAFVHRLPPWRSIAIAFAVVFVIVLFKIGDDANYEFIYFQF
ncbi:MBOAT family O-acyltransferase [Enterovirga rhinocerotis]|uniref:Probable alginate O-acetylase AlgI n=1 Tax=Enterovirga rhinocerotis TaxID=1339210 RepID=A0A4R7BT87_9HYPH|nr:MBOAT family O-acyltransferase [Enterovirga rhinocerotis]TDR87226.1 D-alanyl-lipoteichoic acid acyltransferase DltB (MBOAT superfamily) [Enterovirga rhinocerotis]